MKINNTKIEGDTLWTNVTFTLNDGTEITIDVPHFQPMSEQEVLSGISNRQITEQAKHDAEIRNRQIKEALDNQ